jgi:hypothetical protein
MPELLRDARSRLHRISAALSEDRPMKVSPTPVAAIRCNTNAVDRDLRFSVGGRDRAAPPQKNHECDGATSRLSVIRVT